MDPTGLNDSAFEVSGLIKWFDIAKGYGFIKPSVGPQGDVLLHQTCVRQSGFKAAYEGARVVCEAVQGPKGLQARRLLSLDNSTATPQAAATLKIGPVKATFKARIEMADMDPPRRCTLKGEGQGGVAGFARGEADVTLTPEGDGTALAYTAKATIGGKLAQIGQRLIDGAAKQIADDFFTRFSAAVGAIPAEPDATVPVAEEFSSTPAAIVPTSEIKREGLAPEIWVVGLIGVIVILLLIFGLVL